MNEKGLSKLYWGFLFIMLSFKIQGFDILPDIVGYSLFAFGFRDLASRSDYFSTAAKYNIPMIVLSIFSIYERPAEGAGIHLGQFGILGIPIAIASFVVNLLVVYNLFMGIADMAEKRGRSDLAEESHDKWKKYMMLQIAVILSFIMIIIPPLAIVYIVMLFIITVILAICILGFTKRCNIL